MVNNTNALSTTQTVTSPLVSSHKHDTVTTVKKKHSKIITQKDWSLIKHTALNFAHENNNNRANELLFLIINEKNPTKTTKFRLLHFPRECWVIFMFHLLHVTGMFLITSPSC